MKRFILVLGLACFCAAASPAEPVKAWDPRGAEPIRPLSSKSFVVEFKGGRRAGAIASGVDGTTFLGLYVYDVHGNCVAWDDRGNWATRDDTAVDWFPRENAVYMVEVRNFGVTTNACKIFLR
jgi:hypothetical protein